MAGPVYSFEMLQCLSLVFLEMLFRMFGFMWTPSLAVGFRVVTGKDPFHSCGSSKAQARLCFQGFKRRHPLAQMLASRLHSVVLLILEAVLLH